MLQLNLGSDMFSEIGRLSGIYSTDWSWSPLFCDLDNDGYKDLYITNGIFRRANDLDYVNFLLDDNNEQRKPNNEILTDQELYTKMPLDPLVNYLFRNNGSLNVNDPNQPENFNAFTFTDQSASWGMNIKSYSNGASYADLDNDGDLDIIVNNINDKAFIYRNNSESITGNHSLQFILKGVEMNRFGIGTRIIVYVNNEKRIIENNPTRGFMSSVPPELHIGMGNNDHADSVLILWPGNKFEMLYDVPVDQKIVLDINNADQEFRSTNNGNKNYKIFKEIPDAYGLDFVHKENRYDEFKRQHLIPHKLSSEGPGFAVGDVNSDGHDDVFMGGAKGQRAKLFIFDKHTYKLMDIPDLNKDYGCEDVDAVFFDADLDDDLDLFVVSGGNEASGLQRLMMDRLYINDGTGKFTRRKDLIPEYYHNGSCVRPGDFDGDGDIDLFIGTRSVPDLYGISPKSYLLENNGHGLYMDVTDQKMPELGVIGMVTDAAWLDYDNDNDQDLVVVGEWMTIRILDNENGFLQSTQHPEGIKNSSGWWFSVKTGDIDNDGDQDLIAGNLGLNTMLKPDPDHPVRIYVNDFDRNGSIEQIITTFIKGKEFPFVYRDDLARQLDNILNEYPLNAQFAGQNLQDIFTKEQLDESLIKQVDLFESCLFLNNGTGGFAKVPLPAEVQFAPVKDMLLDDFDQDGFLDVVLGGNFNSVRPLYGRYEASYGWFLKGDGRGGFKIQYPEISGFYARGELNRIVKIRINQQHIILAGINNERAIAFEVKRQ